MTETALLLACLCILLGVATWAYRCEFLATTEQFNKLLKDYEESTRRHRDNLHTLTESSKEAWKAYKRAFLISLDIDKARIAAEEHVKALRAELDEAKARAEAAERSQADTEIYVEETGTAEEAGAVSAENGPVEMVGGRDDCAIVRHTSER